MVQESSSQLAMGAAFGVEPPKEKVFLLQSVSFLLTHWVQAFSYVECLLKQALCSHNKTVILAFVVIPMDTKIDATCHKYYKLSINY